MRKSTGINLLVAATAAAALLAAPAFGAGEPEFIATGVTCGPAFFPTFCAVDISGDGQTILMRDGLWTEAGGLQPIGGPPEGFRVTALSDDGSTVVGNVGIVNELGPHEEAAIWLGGSDWMPLGGLPGTSPCGFSYTSAYDVDAHGDQVVGLAWVGKSCAGGAHGFVWDAVNGMQDLGSIVPDRSSRANVISADGAVIAGWSDAPFGTRLGAVWDDQGLRWFAEPDSGILVGEATGISSDGRFIVGGNYGEDGTFTIFEPWLWSEQTGVIHLGTAKGLRGNIIDGQHFARDVSDDGTVVVGQDTLFQLSEQWAWIWTASEGMAILQDYVRDRNPALESVLCKGERSTQIEPCSGWDLWNIAGVSNDGKVITGTGRNPDGLWEAFIVKLP
ncbi:MAG: hypothetical protein Kow0062_00520 [Acidobacteriota bacterium]